MAEPMFGNQLVRTYLVDCAREWDEIARMKRPRGDKRYAEGRANGLRFAADVLKTAALAKAEGRDG